MIHVFVGTKAQFIKMAPIMRELHRRGTEYNLIDSGQHAGLTGAIALDFGLGDPDVSLRSGDSSIATVTSMLGWVLDLLVRVALKPRWVFEHVFRGQGGICLVHGDTVTTLISVLCARRCGIQVAHVESGLQSHHLLDPFPEEIIRLLTMRLSQVLFSPTTEGLDNLYRMGLGARAVYTEGNTIVDAVRYAVDQTRDLPSFAGHYAVLTTHRAETIYSRSRMEAIVGLAERIARERKVVFVQHEPTQRQLRRFGLEERLVRNPEIEELPLQPYLAFLNLLSKADLVVTDGGSIQEECACLGVPCLVIRAVTEHQEGIGKNVVLSGFSGERTERFLSEYETMRQPICDGTGGSPSDLIVDHLLSSMEQNGSGYRVLGHRAGL